MKRKVGPKGQVVIPKKIRDELGVEPGSFAIQTVVEGHLEIHFLPPEHNRSLLGCLKDLIPPGAGEGLSWEEMREIAWTEAAREFQSKFEPESK
ncbi:MAG: AbrB/MazE/SpoVT family DNA-binding domain-containing protein [Chloroflexi bacterium]|nr:AbrB/MazE/SpoVT family DNA-binding domain-containing protein [Chloroflexota bacterium]MDA1272402.1 AbrB/MazE/SpoVT family DNA-binding domain-containing protein [Chloroflexota bacterium]